MHDSSFGVHDMNDFFSQLVFGFSVKDISIVLLFCLLGHIFNKLTLWAINHWIRRAEARLEQQQLIEDQISKEEKQHQNVAQTPQTNDQPQQPHDAVDPNADLPKSSKIFANGIIKTISNLQSEILKSLKKPLNIFWLTVGSSIGLYIIDIPEPLTDFFSYIFLALKSIGIWCVIWFLLNITNDVVMPRAKQRAKASETPIDEVLYPMLITLFKWAVVATGILTIFQEFGYKLSTLIAGLGLGGAAIALAAKDTIANIFGSVVILLDHPFVLGDWVTINGCEGNIAEIHLRTTKIKTFDDTIVSIPNSILTNTQIDTRGKYKAKMDCSFGVYYSTTPEQIETIVEKIENYINAQAIGPNRIYEPKHYVYFSGFGESSLNITVVAYTHETSYKEHVKLKHKFLLEIIRIVNEVGTGFAFPTRTLDMPQTPIRVELETPAQPSAFKLPTETEKLTLNKDPSGV